MSQPRTTGKNYGARTQNFKDPRGNLIIDIPANPSKRKNVLHVSRPREDEPQSLTGITSNAAPLSCLFGIVCKCDKSLTLHYFFLFYIVRNFDSSFATMIVISSELGARILLGA
jgi:hypothetical protein